VIEELKNSKPRGGSTALCAVFNGKSILVANLGDSQAVIFRKNEFICLSNIHDLRNESEIAEVEKRGGAVLKNRLEGELAISRSIGDINFKRFMSSDPEIFHHKVDDQDEFLIMGTDGYWNVKNFWS
jgi:serine/threonine protein phosphatase PrpC